MWVGEWAGDGVGEWGQHSGDGRYRMVLAVSYIRCRHRAQPPPQCPIPTQVEVRPLGLGGDTGPMQWTLVRQWEWE